MQKVRSHFNEVKTAIILPRMRLWESISVCMRACDVQCGIAIIGRITAWLLPRIREHYRNISHFLWRCSSNDMSIAMTPKCRGRGGGMQHVEGRGGWLDGKKGFKSWHPVIIFWNKSKFKYGFAIWNAEVKRSCGALLRSTPASHLQRFLYCTHPSEEAEDWNGSGGKRNVRARGSKEFLGDCFKSF